MQEEAPKHGRHDLHASVGVGALAAKMTQYFLEPLRLHQERHAHCACQGLLIGLFGLALISAIPHYRNLPHGNIDIIIETIRPPKT